MAGDSSQNNDYNSNKFLKLLNKITLLQICLLCRQLHTYMYTINLWFHQVRGATIPGSFRQTLGGVCRNIADGLTRLGCQPVFLSAIGQDYSSSHPLQEEAAHMVGS